MTAAQRRRSGLSERRRRRPAPIAPVATPIPLRPRSQCPAAAAASRKPERRSLAEAVQQRRRSLVEAVLHHQLPGKSEHGSLERGGEIENESNGGAGRGWRAAAVRGRRGLEGVGRG